MIHVAVSGACGRMGRTLIKLIQESDDLQLAGAVEMPGHPCLGTDAGALAGVSALKVPLSDKLPPACGRRHRLLPAARLGRARRGVRRAGHPVRRRHDGLLAGRNGSVSAPPPRRRPSSSRPNMSVGVNVLFHAAAELARTLGPEYDIEIVEAHHRFKKDAPSGTAIKVAEEIARATGRNLDEAAVHGRGPSHGERKPGEIGFHSIRGGDIVGEHIIYYTTLGERLELKHVAHSRETFARGALRAARWVADRGPGLYSMADVLGF